MIGVVPVKEGWIWLHFATILNATFFLLFGKNMCNIKSIIILSAFCQVINFIFIVTSSMPEVSSDAYNYKYVCQKIANYDTLCNGFKAFLHGIPGSYYYEFSDFGYVSILSTLYYLFGVIAGDIFDIFLKLIAHLYSVYFIYKLSIRLLNKDAALFVALIFGINVFASYYAFSVLKENYFIFVLLLTICQMYKFIEKKKLMNLILFVICVVWSYTFRGSLPIYFIGALFSYFILKDRKPIYTKIYIIFLITFMFVGESVILIFYPETASTLNHRAEVYDSSSAGLFFNLTGPFIAPIPSIASINVNSNLMIIIYSIINLSLSMFCVCGIYYVVKNGMSRLYPILFVLLYNSMMLVLTGYAINARYSYVVSPLYYMFAPIGLKYFYNKWTNFLLIFFILCITYVYNIR